MLGLRTTIYKVSEMTKAKAWYRLAFGVKPYFSEPFYVGFNIKGYELGLLLDQKNSEQKTDNVITYWGVEDIQKSYDEFISYGAKEHESPNNVGGSIMVASVYDPWENVIGIIYNPTFKLP